MDILFDIGRVLLDFDFEASIRRLLNEHPHATRESLMRAIDAREDFECGREHPDAFINRLIRSADGGQTIPAPRMRDAWRRIFTRNAPMWDVVNRLKHAGGHRLILFSNTNAVHCPWIFEEFPEFGVFDGAVLSYEVGAMKPDAAIYEHAIREFGLNPARTRYIDDLPENVAAGERFGFRCHLYDLRRHDRFERWLADEMRGGG